MELNVCLLFKKKKKKKGRGDNLDHFNSFLLNAISQHIY